MDNKDRWGWVSGRPLPDYDDIDALTLFADVDIDADGKERPVDSHARERILVCRFPPLSTW
jgi:hypothetical protein